MESTRHRNEYLDVAKGMGILVGGGGYLLL